DDVGTIFEDREGNIWVGTSAGLDRFREFAVPPFTKNQGLSDAQVYAVLGVRDGSVLVTTPRGLNRWNNGEFTPYGKTIPGQKNTSSPYSVFQDRRGRIWGVSPTEFGYLDNDRFISLTGIPGGVARSIVEDTNGNLWISNQNLGLFHLRGSVVVEQIPWDKLGHRDFAAALAIDPLRGGLWLGFFQGGVAYFKDGQVRATYTPNDGLGQGRVDDLRFGEDSTLWAATAGGLSRLQNNRFATLTSRNGLPCDTIHWL